VKGELLALEEAFWRASGDRDAYEAHLAPDAVHVFPGWGVADREPVLEAVTAAARWDSFRIEEPRVIELTPDAAAIVYTAHAVRGGETYDAAITSVYRRRGEGWKLTLHQQTPL
jgi:hypothetical protein